jgi:hypothetical protein
VQALEAFPAQSLPGILQYRSHRALPKTFHASVAGIAYLSFKYSPPGKQTNQGAQWTEVPAPEPFCKEIQQKNCSENNKGNEIHVKQRLHEMLVGEGHHMQLGCYWSQNIKAGIEQQR